MDTRRMTALVLMIFPVIAFAGWMIFGLGIMGGVGPDTPAEYMAGLGENSATAKILLPIVVLLFTVAIFLGLGSIRDSMVGGAGHYMASIGFLLIIIGSAGQLIETAFTMALAEAASTGNMAVATNMFASGQAVGALITAMNMVGFILFAIGILQQKNFSPILAGLMIVTGIYVLVFCFVDYSSQLLGFGFLILVACLLWLGASLLKQKS
tara:strand:+ start:43 stop:672 length:630 start_codon:yes stop_codon:yes gene_type:complete